MNSNVLFKRLLNLTQLFKSFSSWSLEDIWILLSVHKPKISKTAETPTTWNKVSVEQGCCSAHFLKCLTLNCDGNPPPRVEVSEDFSADHLIQTLSALTNAVSVLIQRCTLPEKQCTALIQLWLALKNQFFRATKSPLNSARWFFMDWGWYFVSFWFFEIFRSTSISSWRLRMLIFKAKLPRESEQKISCSIFVRAKNLIFWVFWYFSN